MARFPFESTLTDQYGRIIVGGTVTVNLTGISTAATIYAAESGGSAITDSQITTGSDGSYKFWVDTADYAQTQRFRLVLNGGDPFVTRTIDDVVIILSIEVTASSTTTFTNKTIDADNNTLSNLEHGAEVDNLSSGIHGVTGSVVGTTDTQTLSAKTLTSPVINTQISGTAFLDEDDMASDSAVKVSSQQAIKKYTDDHTPEYRHGLNCKQASTITITVEGGSVIVDGTVVTKTADTTLTLTTDADWVGGSSQQTTGAYGWIYVDASGNILMENSAPDESDVSGNTSGILRYNDFGGATDYRCIGWFYMNSTGSGELFSYEVSNLKDGDVSNSIVQTDGTNDTLDDTSYGTDLTNMTVHFYTSGRKTVTITGLVTFSAFDTGRTANVEIHDGSDIPASEGVSTSAAGAAMSLAPHHSENYAQGTFTFDLKGKVAAGNGTVADKTIIVMEN